MAGILLSESQRLDWLRLIRSESVGPRTFLSLVGRFGSAGAALEQLPDLGRRAGRDLRICTQAEAEREFQALARLGARLIALGEADYPVPLRAIDSAPPLLAVLGRPEVLARSSVAVVGSRNASAAGLKLTGAWAREFGEAGLVVVSGLARGIDTAAHEASCASGSVAVLAGGLDEVYPPQNLPLLRRLLETGAAVSEMPLGWVPRGRDFPRRNRLISGLSLGTVVVEAARRSGSLITARFANEQGRHVFAVPGSPLDPRAEGGNHLIREGAILCAESAHVIEALQPLISGNMVPQPPAAINDGGGSNGRRPLWDELDLPGLPQVVPAPTSDSSDTALWLPEEAPAEEGTRELLVRLLGTTPVALDDLVRASGRSAGEISRVMIELELDGTATRHPGGGLSRNRS